MSGSRLGTPVEVPWWVVPLAWPPAIAVVAALLVPAPAWARTVAILSSVTVVWLILRIGGRVTGASLQSVWVSTVYGLWTMFLLLWLAGALAAR